MTRSTPLLVLLPALAGCHLFSSGTIGTTCEDLPGGCSGDTAPDDTAPPGPYATHFIVGVTGQGAVTIRVLDGDENVLVEASTDDSRDPGPVAKDEAEERLFYYDNATRFLHVLALGADRVIQGAAPDSGASYIVVVDLEYHDGQLYALAPSALYRVDFETDTFATVVWEGSFFEARSVFSTPDGDLFVLDRGGTGGLPDLWRVDPGSGGITTPSPDFDDGQGRCAGGFLGPADQPWVCSRLGGVYAVADLASGDRTPAALPDAADLEALVGVSALDDVTDCEWDGEASRYLVSSPSAGILGIDTWNSVDQVVPPREGEVPFRAAFLPAPVAR